MCSNHHQSRAEASMSWFYTSLYNFLLIMLNLTSSYSLASYLNSRCRRRAKLLIWDLSTVDDGWTHSVLTHVQEFPEELIVDGQTLNFSSFLLKWAEGTCFHNLMPVNESQAIITFHWMTQFERYRVQGTKGNCQSKHLTQTSWRNRGTSAHLWDRSLPAPVRAERLSRGKTCGSSPTTVKTKMIVNAILANGT